MKDAIWQIEYVRFPRPEKAIGVEEKKGLMEAANPHLEHFLRCHSAVHEVDGTLPILKSLNPTKDCQIAVRIRPMNGSMIGNSVIIAVNGEK